MKKGLIIFAIVLLICCVVLSAGGFYVYQTYILPNADSDSTVTINGQQVTQMRRTPTSFNNLVIESQTNFISKLNDLGKLTKDNATLEKFNTSVQEINTILDKNIQTLDLYKTTLVQYNDYKDFIDATRQYYVDYKTAINKAYSNDNLTKLFAAQITEDTYNKIVGDMEELNNTITKLDADFGKAQDAFAAKYNIKLVTK
jgi:hypothetical protein